MTEGADFRWNRRESFVHNEAGLDASIAVVRQYYDNLGGMPPDIDNAVHRIEGPIKEAMRNAEAGTFDAQERANIIDQLNAFDRDFKNMVSPGNKIDRVGHRIGHDAWKV